MLNFVVIWYVYENFVSLYDVLYLMNLYYGKILKKNLRLQNKFKGDLKLYIFVVWYFLFGLYI